MTDCPVCGLPTELVREWYEGPRTDPTTRVLIRCPLNHWIAMNRSELPVESPS